MESYQLNKNYKVQVINIESIDENIDTLGCYLFIESLLANSITVYPEDFNSVVTDVLY